MQRSSTRIGFILACTLCFMLAVRGLRQSEGAGSGGPRRWVLDFVIGCLIAAPAFWLFTQVLAHQPAGPHGHRLAVAEASMDIWQNLLAGFATAGTPINLMWAFIGCALGTAIGVLPGIGPAVTVAMLLPITAQVEPTASMIFFAGIYYGAMYGGSTTSILLNTPGETGTMVTALEGFKMAKSGRAGAALATSAIGSFVAGTIATVLVTLFAPIVADYAVLLGPPEYVLLMLLAFTTVSAVLGEQHAARPDGALRRPGDRPGRARPDHRPGALRGQRARTAATASRWCWWRWACSRSANACTRRCTRAASARSQPHELACT